MTSAGRRQLLLPVGAVLTARARVRPWGGADGFGRAGPVAEAEAYGEEDPGGRGGCRGDERPDGSDVDAGPVALGGQDAAELADTPGSVCRRVGAGDRSAPHRGRRQRARGPGGRPAGGVVGARRRPGRAAVG